MTLDQKIQIWNVVGTWLASIGTILAVIVALYLARHGEAIRLKIHVGLRVVVGGGDPEEEFVTFDVTNLAGRPATINSIGWAVGKGKKRKFGLQTVAGRYTSQFPMELAYGKKANFMVPLEPFWLKEFATEFLPEPIDESLKTLRALVHMSVGVTVESKPEPGLLDKLQRAHDEFKS